MKVGIISDIHIDINKEYNLVKGLCDVIKQKELETLIIAGDISNNYKETLKFIDSLIEASKIKIYFVPGNHDLWDLEKEFNDTRIIYDKIAAHQSCVCGKVINLTDKYNLVGDVGWYDYSFGENKFTYEEFNEKSKYDRTWQDSINVKWYERDIEFNNRCLESIENTIKLSDGKEIIAVTHMITHPHFKVPIEREKWDYFNAFLGSDKYGKLYEGNKVKYAIMGHVHYRKSYEENGVKYICSCLNYNTEWDSKELLEQLNKAITIIEIE